MARRLGRTSARPILLPVITPTASLTADLAAIYMRAVHGWRDQLSAVVLPAYEATMAELRDAFTDAQAINDDLADVRNAAEGAGESMNRLLLLLTPALREWVVKAERWHRLKWSRNVMTPTGVDLATMIGPEDVRETLESVLARNVGLIRSVSDETRARVADIVFRGFQKRTPTRAIARELTAAVGLARRRALNIAVDQTVKLSAALDTERMLQVGLTDWRWIHSGKKHYRPEHKARNGRIYTFKRPPADMPGELPYCGCKKQGVLRLPSGRWSAGPTGT